MWRHIIHHAALHTDLTFRWGFEPSKHPQGCCLATARRSHNRNEFAFINGEIHGFYRGEITKAFYHGVKLY